MENSNENKDGEEVLAITRTAFENMGSFNGYKSLRGKQKELTDLLSDETNTVFSPRSSCETDTNLKQLIPYIAIVSGDKILAYERSSSGSEERLHGQMSVGVGGHVNKEDGFNNPVLAFMEGAAREAKEEIGVEVDLTTLGKSIYGLVNDESNPVGQVHLGVCIVLKLDEDQEEEVIKQCEHTLLNPKFVPIIDLEDPAFFMSLETWSQYFSMGYIAERCINGKWHDPGFRERVNMLAMVSANLSSTATGYLLEETPRAHMKARSMLEAGAGEVQCMLKGLIANDDISEDKIVENAQKFMDVLKQNLRYQSEQ
jgi:predicted NUDIX family phosphoesterase